VSAFDGVTGDVWMIVGVLLVRVLFPGNAAWVCYSESSTAVGVFAATCRAHQGCQAVSAPPGAQLQGPGSVLPGPPVALEVGLGGAAPAQLLPLLGHLCHSSSEHL